MSYLRSFANCSNSILIRTINKSFVKICCFSTSSKQLRIESNVVNIFDRNTKSLQRERAARAEDVNLYDYLKDEIGFRLADRVFDIKRKFKLAADLG